MGSKLQPSHGGWCHLGYFYAYLEKTNDKQESEDEYLEEPVEDSDDLDNMNNQAVQIAHTSPHGTYEVVVVSDGVVYCQNTRENCIQCAYAGFDNK